MSTTPLAQKARKAAALCLSVENERRNMALQAIADALIQNMPRVIAANGKDVRAAQKAGLSAAMVNRLEMGEAGVMAMAQAVRAIADQPDVVGDVVETYDRPNGLRVRRERVPLGVIAMIFESRPNVVIDCSALAIKSGNAILLKGGKEAAYSNKILGEIVRAAIKPYLPQDTVIVLDSTSRKSVQELLKLPQYIDLVIPRGGEGLVKYVVSNAQMPVVAHYKGICHVYVHDDADLHQALDIAVNAKIQRPGVCNAMETLLLNKHIAEPFLRLLIPTYVANGVEIRGCLRTRKIGGKNVRAASSKDWDTEYLDKIISVKIVGSVDDAIAHIQKHGTHHTEAICAKDADAIRKFVSNIDASCLMVNASTRFNDGGELGLGAEMGISTSKVHAYGPMGARELTTTRFVVEGAGQIRR
jgi:glutamate-5-semialdehyde dehydrogenase